MSEVSLHSSASEKFYCSWTGMKLHVGSETPSTNSFMRGRASDLFRALSVSPTLHRSTIGQLRLKVILLSRSILHECTGSCCPQCRAKMRRRILGQISQDLE